MKKFSNIIMSDEEPRDKTVLWLKDGVLYQFEGGWKPVLKSNPSESIKNDIPVFKKGNTQDIKNHNLAICDSIKINKLGEAIAYVENYSTDDIAVRLVVPYASDSNILAFVRFADGTLACWLKEDGTIYYDLPS